MEGYDGTYSRPGAVHTLGSDMSRSYSEWLSDRNEILTMLVFKVRVKIYY